MWALPYKGFWAIIWKGEVIIYGSGDLLCLGVWESSPLLRVIKSRIEVILDIIGPLSGVLK